MQRPPFGYYEPPSTKRGRPAVITWFRVYAATALAMYVGFFVLWQFLTPSGAGEVQAAAAPTFAGVVTVAVLGLVVLAFAGLFAVSVIVPYRPWGWTVGLVAICLGLSSCMVLASVPLLIYWMKP